MKARYVKALIFIFIIGLLSGCGSQSAGTPASVSQPTNPPLSADTAAPATQAAAQGGTVSFVNEVLPILKSRCVNCHGADRVEKGLGLQTYHDVMAGSENGPVVTSGKAVDSKLVQLIVNQKMPKRGPKLTPPQVQLITNWVNQGALNN
ncbi:MAG TPA: c-type cytochrome domain-containing protein [Anaerolineales bacterium]|nr:c-type cytochrome domain-containing protein [Anaerolineales bacterium]